MTKKNSTARRLERVRNEFSAEDLIRICSQTDFSNYAQRIDLGTSRDWRGQPTEDFYYYRDNGAPILAVAHLDHVQKDGTCTVVETRDGPLALSGALDDRLGAYVILEMLPRLGVEVDWLLTTNEEMGASTATAFNVDHKDYNWLIEFDRGGTDVVLYQYETPDLRQLVKSAGAVVGEGSYSDIADLEQLGCAGLNWGVGYYDYHSRRAHAWLDDTFALVGKFLRFYSANAATLLPYDGMGDNWLEDANICPLCNSGLDSGACWNCGYGWDNEATH